MKKDGISLLEYNGKDNTVDLTQAERSMYGGATMWTTDMETFAGNYKATTGKEIKTFDALTKALCMGEIAVSACDLSIALTSKNYLEKKVAECAASKDEEYVMSLTRASSLNWIPDYENKYNDFDYHFSSIEYIDFGNDRKYVDIDKMFEMNDNFEITLEGEKEPIKSWEELEAKIKSLNAKISDALLNKIHEKYNEIEKEADKQHKENLKTHPNEEIIDINNSKDKNKELSEQKRERKKQTPEEKIEALYKKYEELSALKDKLKRENDDVKIKYKKRLGEYLKKYDELLHTPSPSHYLRLQVNDAVLTLDYGKFGYGSVESPDKKIDNFIRFIEENNVTFEALDKAFC